LNGSIGSTTESSGSPLATYRRPDAEQRYYAMLEQPAMAA